jgi:glycosyltransferase involved in cell wall biosynthesis
MLHPCKSIIREFTREDNEKLNILTWVTHERYENSLCTTDQNFYSLVQNGTKEWNHNYANVPENYMIFNDSIPDYINIDLVISQNPGVHINLANLQTKQVCIPIINVFHTTPIPTWNDQSYQEHLKFFGLCDHHVFISDYNKENWGFGDREDTTVIDHGIDNSLFKPVDVERRNHILSVANDYKNRDWALGYYLYDKITKNLPTFPVGDTKGLSKCAKNTTELIKIYQESKIFINTSLHSPIPMSMLEAMSCECAVVTTNTCAIPSIIEHGVNGLMFDPKKPEDGEQYLRDLLNDDDMAKELGQNARKTIIDRFNLTQFKNGWNKVFNDVLNNKENYIPNIRKNK